MNEIFTTTVFIIVALESIREISWKPTSFVPWLARSCKKLPEQDAFSYTVLWQMRGKLNNVSLNQKLKNFTRRLLAMKNITVLFALSHSSALWELLFWSFYRFLLEYHFWYLSIVYLSLIRTCLCCENNFTLFNFVTRLNVFAL